MARSFPSLETAGGRPSPLAQPRPPFTANLISTEGCGGRTQAALGRLAGPLFRFDLPPESVRSGRFSPRWRSAEPTRARCRALGRRPTRRSRTTANGAARPGDGRPTGRRRSRHVRGLLSSPRTPDGERNDVARALDLKRVPRQADWPAAATGSLAGDVGSIRDDPHHGGSRPRGGNQPHHHPGVRHDRIRGAGPAAAGQDDAALRVAGHQPDRASAGRPGVAGDAPEGGGPRRPPGAGRGVTEDGVGRMELAGDRRGARA